MTVKFSDKVWGLTYMVVKYFKSGNFCTMNIFVIFTQGINVQKLPLAYLFSCLVISDFVRKFSPTKMSENLLIWYFTVMILTALVVMIVILTNGMKWMIVK